MPDFPLSGAILAGGRSSRMGRDKAFLPFPAPDGPPLIARQASLLREAGITELLISGRRDTDYTQAVPDARVVFDTRPNSGPLAGLAAALASARHPWLLVIAIDQPRLTAGYLHKLIRISAGATGVVPQGPRGFEPLVGIYPRSLLPQIEAALATTDLSLQSLLTKASKDNYIQCVKIDPTESVLFTNWNSPADLSA